MPSNTCFSSNGNLLRQPQHSGYEDAELSFLPVATSASSQGIFGTDGDDGRGAPGRKGGYLSRDIQTRTPSVFLYDNRKLALSLGIRYVIDEPPTEAGATNLFRLTSTS